jgi:hypothetical protein
MRKTLCMFSSVVFVIFLAGLFAPASMAQTWDKKTRITAAKPWALPNNVVLPAGTYVMRLYDSASNRQIVEVWNADETKIQTRLIGIPAYRLTPSDNTVLNFYERKTPGPQTLHSWFYPGSNSGVEFPAPKSAAADLAYVDVKAPEPTAVAEAQPSASSPEVAEAPAPAPAPEATAEPQPEPQPKPEEPKLVAELNPPPAPQRELPRTAGNLPLIALIGLLSLAGAAFTRS